MKLANYIKQIRGVSYKPADILDHEEEGYIPLLRANNIKEGIINFDNLVYVNSEKVKKEQIMQFGDILVCTSSGSKDLVGKAGTFRSKKEYTFGAFCKVIRPVNINSEYLSNFFQSQYYRRTISQHSRGANINNLKQENFDDLKINIPVVEEQSRIASQLGLIFDLIINKKRQIDKCDDLIKSQFNEMFNDTDKYPKEFLKDNVIEMFIGPFGSSLKNDCFVDESNASCVVYEQKHAINKYLGDFRFINVEKHNELKRFEIHPNDIIVSCRGTIGETYVIPEGAPLGIMHPSIMKIRLDTNKYDPVFFNEVIKKYLNDNLNMTKGGIIKMGIKATELGNTKFIKPEIDEQKRFINIKNKIDKQKCIFEKQLKKIEEMQSALMQEYFG